ncbi:DM domain-containing protein [Aphelenchoides bicaudatus]|nr:DM domain-containing protein [Aphelenchoides bicaudatus]
MNMFSHFNSIFGVSLPDGQFESQINKRVYYCQRCLNHGQLRERKNHKNDCFFTSCQCAKCVLVDKRRFLNAQLHKLEQKKEREENDDTSPLQPTPNFQPFCHFSSASCHRKGGWFVFTSKLL